MTDTELHAARIREFLNDELVQTALQAMKDVNYRAFVDAKDDDARRMAQAKALVLGDFEAALQVVVDAGERARITRERSERSPGARHSTE